MNNEKRVILAIALYAAVITMVLHTLDSEGHERFTSIKQSAQINDSCEAITSVSLMNVSCTETTCNDQGIVASPFNASFTTEDESVLILNDEVNG